MPDIVGLHLTESEMKVMCQSFPNATTKSKMVNTQSSSN